MIAPLLLALPVVALMAGLFSSEESGDEAPQLAALLRSSDASQREAAAIAAGKRDLSHAHLVPSLMFCVDDVEVAVCDVALRALHKIGCAGVEELAERLELGAFKEATQSAYRYGTGQLEPETLAAGIAGDARHGVWLTAFSEPSSARPHALAYLLSSLIDEGQSPPHVLAALAIQGAWFARHAVDSGRVPATLDPRALSQETLVRLTTLLASAEPAEVWAGLRLVIVAGPAARQLQSRVVAHIGPSGGADEAEGLGTAARAPIWRSAVAALGAMGRDARGHAEAVYRIAAVCPRSATRALIQMERRDLVEKLLSSDIDLQSRLTVAIELLGQDVQSDGALGPIRAALALPNGLASASGGTCADAVDSLSTLYRALQGSDAGLPLVSGDLARAADRVSVDTHSGWYIDLVHAYCATARESVKQAKWLAARFREVTQLRRQGQWHPYSPTSIPALCRALQQIQRVDGGIEPLCRFLLLHDDSAITPATRLRLITFLGMQPELSDEALEVLTGLAKGQREFVGEKGSEPGRPSLPGHDLLRKCDCRLGAIDALSRVAVRSAEAERVLRSVSEDPSPAVRAAAALGLRRLLR